MWLLLFASLLGAMWGTHVVVRQLREYLRTRRWHKTQGTLESVRTKQVVMVGDPSAALPDEGPFNVFVKYTYDAAGTNYAGNRFNVLDACVPFVFNHDKRLLRELNDAASQKRPMVVWFNPRDPQQSLLTLKFYGGRFVFNLLLTILAWWGLAFLWNRFSITTLAISTIGAFAVGKFMVFINRAGR